MPRGWQRKRQNNYIPKPKRNGSNSNVGRYKSMAVENEKPEINEIKKGKNLYGKK